MSDILWDYNKDATVMYYQNILVVCYRLTLKYKINTLIGIYYYQYMANA